MATFDTVINVDVRLESPPVSRAGFSTSMVVDVHGAGFTERIRRYESATEVNADTDLSTFAKNALLAALSQSPRPSVVAAGRKDAAALKGKAEANRDRAINRLIEKFKGALNA